MSTWRRGDVVVLKSGGPFMTIKELVLDLRKAPTSQVLCVWFKKEQLVSGYFESDTLLAKDIEIDIPRNKWYD